MRYLQMMFRYNLRETKRKGHYQSKVKIVNKLLYLRYGL